MWNVNNEKQDRSHYISQFSHPTFWDTLCPVVSFILLWMVTFLLWPYFIDKLGATESKFYLLQAEKTWILDTHKTKKKGPGGHSRFRGISDSETHFKGASVTYGINSILGQEIMSHLFPTIYEPNKSERFQYFSVSASLAQFLVRKTYCPLKMYTQWEWVALEGID